VSRKCRGCDGKGEVILSADPNGKLIESICPLCGGSGVFTELHDAHDKIRPRRKRTAAQKKVLTRHMLMADPDGNEIDPTISPDATVVTPGTAEATIRTG
jgi:hypothetical protein